MNRTESETDLYSGSEGGAPSSHPAGTQSTGRTVSTEQAAELNAVLSRLDTLEQTPGGQPGMPKWFARFKKRFHVAASEALPVEKYAAALGWLNNRVQDLTRSVKRREISLRRKENYAAIKAKMWDLHGKKKYTEEEKRQYYHEFSQGLGLREFCSLTELSDRDLGRVAAFVSKLFPPLDEAKDKSI